MPVSQDYVGTWYVADTDVTIGSQVPQIPIWTRHTRPLPTTMRATLWTLLLASFAISSSHENPGKHHGGGPGVGGGKPDKLKKDHQEGEPSGYGSEKFADLWLPTLQYPSQGIKPIKSHQTHQTPSKPIKSHQNPSNPIKSHQIPSNPIESHQIPSKSIKSHQKPSNPIESHQTSSNPIKTHQIPSNPIESHRIPSNPIKTIIKTIPIKKNFDQITVELLEFLKLIEIRRRVLRVRHWIMFCKGLRTDQILHWNILIDRIDVEKSPGLCFELGSSFWSVERRLPEKRLRR